LSVAYARINLSAALAMSLIALTSTLGTRTVVLLEAAPPERTHLAAAHVGGEFERVLSLGGN
jgi:hypothetical protein